MPHSVLKQAHQAEEALWTGSTLSDSQAVSCSSRNANAKAQRALESSSKLQKPPRKLNSQPPQNPIYATAPWIPYRTEQDKSQLHHTRANHSLCYFIFL